MGRTELELEKAPLNGTRRLGAKARARRHAPSAIRGCFRFDPLTLLLSPSPPSSSTSQVDHPIPSAIRLGSGAPEATMTRTLDPPKSRPPGPHHSTLASPPNAFLSTQLFPSPPPPASAQHTSPSQASTPAAPSPSHEYEGRVCSNFKSLLVLCASRSYFL